MRSLRRAVPEHAEWLAELAYRAYEKYSYRLGAAPEPVGADYVRLINEAIVYIRPGEDEGLSASLVLIPKSDHLLLWSIAIEPSQQGRGLGRKIMKFVEREAIRLGLDEIRLYTNERMVENVGFYAALGYHETHHSPSARIAGTRRVHMAKRLGGG